MVDRAQLARRARSASERRPPPVADPSPRAGRRAAALPGEPGYRPRGTPQYFEGDIDRLEWDDFLQVYTWRGADGSRDSQHVTLIAATRDGKSHLANELEKASDKNKVVVFAAKPPGDPALEGLKRQGYRHVTEWPWRDRLGVRTGPKAEPGERFRILFWPKIGPGMTAREWVGIRGRYARAMDDIFAGPWVAQTGTGWVERWDEGIYSTQPKFLGMRDRMEDHWQRIAGNDSSLMFLCQRSSTVPLLAYDQIGHLFAGRCNDRRDAERVGEMMGQDRLMVRDALAHLERFEFLWFDKETGALAIVKAPPPRGKR